MIFLNSDFLLFMVLPLIILGYFIVTNKKVINIYFKKEVLQKLIIKRGDFGIFAKNILLFFALFMFILSLSRPVSPKDEITLKTRVPSYAILLDISASMLAKDIVPNRYEFSKKKIKELIKNSSAKISLYAFSDKLYQISPPTTDKKVLLFLLDHLDIDPSLFRSSNLKEAIRNIPQTNIILFSDGTQEKDFSSIKKLKKSITIYLSATKDGAPILKDKEYLKDKNQNIVISKANYNISQIGRVISFSYQNDTNLIIKNSNQKAITFSLKEFDELYPYPMYLGALALFLVFFSLKPLRSLLILVILFYPHIKAQAIFLDFIDIKKAKEAYEKKEYKEAVKEFKKVASSKKSPQSYYNLANAYYKNKEYEKALKTYQKVIAKDKDLRYKTFFNMANCYYKLKNYKKAYEFYKIAYEINPTKKVIKNLKIIKSLYKGSDDKKVFANIPIEMKQIYSKDLKAKTFMIELTKGKDVETSQDW